MTVNCRLLVGSSSWEAISPVGQVNPGQLEGPLSALWFTLRMNRVVALIPTLRKIMAFSMTKTSHGRSLYFCLCSAPETKLLFFQTRKTTTVEVSGQPTVPEEEVDEDVEDARECGEVDVVDVEVAKEQEDLLSAEEAQEDVQDGQGHAEGSDALDAAARYCQKAYCM